MAAERATMDRAIPSHSIANLADFQSVDGNVVVGVAAMQNRWDHAYRNPAEEESQALARELSDPVADYNRLYETYQFLHCSFPNLNSCVNFNFLAYGVV